MLFRSNGNPTASTGDEGANPFVLEVPLDISAGSITVTGRVTDGTNAISDASVWAYRTDGPGFAESFTDGSGNYVLYLTSNATGTTTWQLESHAPGFGHLGSTSLSVGDEDIIGQNFQRLDSSDLGNVTGTIDVPGTTDDSGVMVWMYGPVGFNEAITESDGSFSMSVPKGVDVGQYTYNIEAWHPSTGTIFMGTDGTVHVDGDEIVNPNGGTIADLHEFEIDIQAPVDADTVINLSDDKGHGQNVVIPAGQTKASVSLPDGEYFMDMALPGIDEDALTIVGAEFNNVNGNPTDDSVIDIDGDGDLDFVLSGTEKENENNFI